MIMIGRRFKAYSCLLLTLAITWHAPTQAADDPALEQFFIASAAYNRKLYPVAVAQFQGFLQKNGSHAKADQARRGLAISLYALKLYEKAMPEFATLLAKPNLDRAINRERMIMLQSKCMMNLGKKDEARKLFIEQLKNLRTPSYKTAALAAICDVSFGKSEWDKVIEWTAKLATSKPNPDQAAPGLGPGPGPCKVCVFVCIYAYVCICISIYCSYQISKYQISKYQISKYLYSILYIYITYYTFI